MAAVLRLGALIAALALAGCGGEDAVTREEFAERANELCQRAIEDIERAADENSSVVAVLEESREIGERLVRELRALEAPEEAQAEVEGLIQAYEDTLPQVDAAISAVREERLDEVPAILEEVEEIGNRGDRFASELGADTCTEEPNVIPGG